MPETFARTFRWAKGGMPRKIPPRLELRQDIPAYLVVWRARGRKENVELIACLYIILREYWPMLAIRDDGKVCVGCRDGSGFHAIP